jgi:hypothetical protein
VSDFLQEIKEDVQREQLHALWKRYGYLAILTAILVVLVTAISIWWNNTQIQQQQQAGNSFYKAVTQEHTNPSDAAASFEAIKQQNAKGFSALAGLREAQIFVKAGQTDKALLIYKAVADNSKNDRALRDLAAIHAVNIRMNSGKADASDDAILQNLAAEKSPWRYSAVELQGLRALSQNNKQAAKEYFTLLSKDTHTPTDVRNRAEQVLVVMGATVPAKISTSPVGKK